MKNEREFAERVDTMTVWELLETVMNNPEYLSDHYYIRYGQIISDRFEDLQAARASNAC